MNTGPGTHMMQLRFETIRAEFETCIQTAVGERVGCLQTLTCNRELENILKTSQNTQFILNKIYEQEIIFLILYVRPHKFFNSKQKLSIHFLNYDHSEIFLPSQNYTCIHKNCNLSFPKNYYYYYYTPV
jgi:hypothetical protein